MTGLLDDADIAALADTALKNLFMVQFRLGMADPVSVQPEWIKYGASVVDTPAHRALAKEAADQSMVLLKNSDHTLPFKATSGMKLAVMGREALATKNMQGNYFGTAPFLVSPAAGVARYGNVTSYNGADIASAVSKVKGQDAVVLVVGLQSEGAQPADEAEGKDRDSLLLPGNQDDFVKQVAAAAAADKIPVAVVVMGGGPLDISAIKANVNVGAIMWCGYPGQSGGDSIADTLFGKNNPAGKLSVTWYPEELTKQVKITYMGMRPNKATGSPGRSYRFYTGTPVFKFGEGLSYSKFDSKVSAAPRDVSLSIFPKELTLTSLTKTTAAKVSVKTINLSERDGAETVMLFLASPNAGNDGEPIQTLVAFEKINVPAGQTVVTDLEINSQFFALASLTGERSVAKGVWKLWVGHDGKDNAVDIQVGENVVYS